MSIVISTFYKFVPIADPRGLRDALHAPMHARDMRGTLLIAEEGINGTVSGDVRATDGFVSLLRADARFADITVKSARRAQHPFKRLKIKAKREIITFPLDGADTLAHVGTAVRPEDWNALLSESNVLVLDTRNAYEVEAGTFEGALDPKTRSFSQFAEFVRTQLASEKDRKVAMFCTGGIRCEKASAFMKAQGFRDVFQLEGGILNYLEKVPERESLWRGECFVFDERVTVSARTLGSSPL